MPEIKLHPSWKEALADEFTQPYWIKLTDVIRRQYLEVKMYPPPKQIFRALDLVPPEDVKVVILGQDPYINKNQANGLAFSVNKGEPLPPSLQNIYKEIQHDIGVNPPMNNGDLVRWSDQGVLLLNSVLTVRAGMSASSGGLGWEQFSNAVIKVLNKQHKYIVYMLWGKYAQTKGAHINVKQNLVLRSGHPSPLSADLFFNHNHFSKCNYYLIEHAKEAINWC